ncbi:hypothetical protein C8R44DRAFT_988366 [Mycena epipterygia]|nr:hypothetical protein C8R44DRAFT_988366 [Mycena epipterygia]
MPHPTQPVMGRFTAALLTAIRHRRDLSTTTYSDLVKSLDPTVLGGQHPHCGHMNQNWLVFTNTKSGDSWLLQQIPSNPDTFRVDIGALQGVCEATEFVLVTSDGSSSSPLIVDDLQSDHSILRLTQGSRPMDGYRVRITHWNNSLTILKVSGDDTILQLVVDHDPGKRFIVVAADDKPDLILRNSNDRHILEWKTGLMSTDLVPEDLQKATLHFSNQNHLSNILDGLAHFNYVLNYHSGSVQSSNDDVQLKLYQLEGNFGARTVNMQVGNIVQNHAIKLTADNRRNYAFEMSNNTQLDLFPYLFYLNPKTYEISEIYLPPGGDLTPTLPSQGTLTVGAGAERAFNFKASSMFAVMKMFVFTKYHNLDSITQRSVFDVNFAGKGKGRNFEREPVEFWKAIQITVEVAQEEEKQKKWGL